MDLELSAPHPAAMTRIGAALGRAAAPGDALLLEGDLGAGKTTLARAILQGGLGASAAREASSPSFALVHEHAGPGGLWRHADLYRLRSAAELEELGLLHWTEAVSLVEWPEALGGRAPRDALRIRIVPTPEGGRLLSLTASGPRGEALAAAARAALAAAPDRAEALEALLEDAGWSAAERLPLAGDASARRYLRLRAEEGLTSILMDCAPATGLSVTPFGAVGEWLRGRGFSAPEILAADPEAGYLLLEDLGEGLFARLCAADAAREPELYALAVETLAQLQEEPIPEALSFLGTVHRPPAYDEAIISREAALLVDVWAPAAGNPLGEAERAEWLALVLAALAPHRAEAGYVHVDYHAENLLHMPERPGAAALGILDHQDARRGSGAYDLASLLEDARRDVSPDLAEALKLRFAERTGRDPRAFALSHDAWAAQRNAKILGLFARFALRGDSRYVKLIPRVWSHFRRDLSAPALKPLADFVARHIPAPGPEILARLASPQKEPSR
ncbi:tRNA (adenosine(37)-N6)-threonylcarbamoyltransferase complex ATPase subunit type 1 TsaE [Neomegalonema sp.]|uniref:tRNA (adenosine(37)-N6)-threonylcarbamoyltransferase complex ATPase subunit type 1 TsaE n=1 Tax=Neomegalonema sp. TaxID=2039713 RepID=UPI0026282658|nr:tRNA (adenosine(37)-N6)-threonylcarbamoyltransferase complex ATPase subunit type 1 TsaE [Neomegalonema sp.]MDD2869447.1 tRNA (adenosine(37)-N6)-threonylcarbamoyltransferase complex ATPase subunit type 1 TsaE [Neomegalonema sp.]